MKTIAILSQKGGTGKTTLTLHLAVAAQHAGVPAAVLDLDPQASASGWKDSREAEAPSVTSIQASRLGKALQMAAASGTALVLIDTAPHSADAAIAAAEAADLILIPCRAGILDLRAIAATAKIAKLAGKPAYVVLNHAPHRAPRVEEDARDAVAQHDLTLAPVVLHQRAAYGHALTLGQTAAEFEPDGKADGEVRELLAWVRTQLSL
ncbi:nucleotide-binding protein [Lichenifustis flavocetrariae]|uniref:AAA family ATPase n=1 Tax=Lichenifustis flavocetrariae TaxID=2949735 RepID=A0AA41YU77_9HYPH|nr:AAA family ATPase [Lichenifustis flavocetrariae]MCW6508661.1 AAA family ATPase [Lichenifustis flavocetrariae]